MFNVNCYYKYHGDTGSVDNHAIYPGYVYKCIKNIENIITLADADGGTFTIDNSKNGWDTSFNKSGIQEDNWKKKFGTVIDTDDRVEHPSHYCNHPSNIECIEITRHYCFDIGNAIKYLWRAGLKSEEGMSNSEKEIQDLKKAIWYINDRIKMLENENNN